MKKEFSSVKEFFFIDSVKRGLIKLKDGTYVKIIEVKPINLNLKTDFEKETIVSNYKNFLQTLDSDIQIIIQSKKTNLNNHIENIKFNSNQYPNIKNLAQDYIKFIEEKKNQSLCSKNFYIVISSKENSNNNFESINQELEKKYKKIKSQLEKCGNEANDFSSDTNKLEEIIFSFFNVRLNTTIYS